jgi:hypothetical protein
MRAPARRRFLAVILLAGTVWFLPSAHLALNEAPGVQWEFDTDG